MYEQKYRIKNFMGKMVEKKDVMFFFSLSFFLRAITMGLTPSFQCKIHHSCVSNKINNNCI